MYEGERKLDYDGATNGGVLDPELKFRGRVIFVFRVICLCLCDIGESCQRSSTETPFWWLANKLYFSFFTWILYPKKAHHFASKRMFHLQKCDKTSLTTPLLYFIISFSA